MLILLEKSKNRSERSGLTSPSILYLVRQSLQSIGMEKINYTKIFEERVHNAVQLLNNNKRPPIINLLGHLNFTEFEKFAYTYGGLDYFSYNFTTTETTKV